jgi:hypothetical protein
MPIYSENKIISLNSLYGIQQNGTALSNILFNTGLILQEDDSIIDSHISVLNCQLPVSFYTINATNNQIRASFSGGAFLLYSIPIGNYNSYSLISTLQTLFNNLVVITFNTNTGTFTYTAPSTTFSFAFNITNSSYQILGFLPNLTYTASLGVLTSSFPINLLGIKRISIKSFYLGVSSYTGQGEDVGLCVIPNDQPPYNMLSYQNPTNIDKQKLNVKMINKIDILIYDENNNFIDFNNCNWTLTLCLENTKYKPDIISSFKEIINNKSIENEKLGDKDLEELDLLSNP